MSLLLEGSFPAILHLQITTFLIKNSIVLLVFDALDLVRPGPIGLGSFIDFAMANCSSCSSDIYLFALNSERSLIANLQFHFAVLFSFIIYHRN
jgi:hypothetical protein